MCGPGLSRLLMKKTALRDLVISGLGNPVIVLRTRSRACVSKLKTRLVSIQQELLSQLPERLFIPRPLPGDGGPVLPGIDRAPQTVGSIEDVDRQLLVLVLVRRIAPHHLVGRFTAELGQI